MHFGDSFWADLNLSGSGQLWMHHCNYWCCYWPTTVFCFFVTWFSFFQLRQNNLRCRTSQSSSCGLKLFKLHPLGENVWLAPVVLCLSRSCSGGVKHQVTKWTTALWQRWSPNSDTPYCCVRPQVCIGNCGSSLSGLTLLISLTRSNLRQTREGCMALKHTIKMCQWNVHCQFYFGRITSLVVE